jgi:hypothetical protein
VTRHRGAVLSTNSHSSSVLKGVRTPLLDETGKGNLRSRKSVGRPSSQAEMATRLVCIWKQRPRFSFQMAGCFRSAQSPHCAKLGFQITFKVKKMHPFTIRLLLKAPEAHSYRKGCTLWSLSTLKRGEKEVYASEIAQKTRLKSHC